MHKNTFVLRRDLSFAHRGGWFCFNLFKIYSGVNHFITVLFCIKQVPQRGLLTGSDASKVLWRRNNASFIFHVYVANLFGAYIDGISFYKTC